MYSDPPLDALFSWNVKLNISTLLDWMLIAPPDLVPALFFSNVQFVILENELSQYRAPPSLLAAVLFLNVQFVRLPLSPYHIIAPPLFDIFPFIKVVFFIVT